MRSPLVSIVLTAFRHRKYIEEAVQSCLAQTLSNIEIIIVDDGSGDGTIELLKSFFDPRLMIIQQKNAGPSIAINHGLRAASAPYIALMSGDDICLPDRLERQLASLNYLCADAVFGRPVIINETGDTLPDSSMSAFFHSAPSSSLAMLRDLFFDSNFLCAPTAFFRRNVVDDCGSHHPALYQTQDFDLWFRMCMRHRVCLTDDRVVKYRVRDNSGNLSGPRNLSRTRIELNWVYQKLLRSLDSEMLRVAFAEDIELWGMRESPYEDQRILICLLHSDPEIRRQGFHSLIDRFEKPESHLDEIRFGGLTLAARDLASLLSVSL